jgi:hypothetical protein
MLTRRRFLKTFGLAGLAFSLLPPFLTRRSFSGGLDDEATYSAARNKLYGVPRKGCSSHQLVLESRESKFRNLADFGIPPEFAHNMSHEQYLS